MLSGRSSTQIFNVEEEDLQDVLGQSAELLDMDPDLVERSGALMSGTSGIQDLQDGSLSKWAPIGQTDVR